MRPLLAALPLLLAACAGQAVSSSGSQNVVRPAPGAARVDQLPKLVSCSAPVNNMSRGVYAQVTVRMTVDQEGQVAPETIAPFGRIAYVGTQSASSRDEVAALRSREDAILDWALRNAATCRFEPAMMGGAPVPVSVRVAFRYVE